MYSRGAYSAHWASAAIEHIFAQIFHLEDGGVGTAGGRLQDMRLGHLRDDDMVVALLDDRRHLAFDGGGRGVEDRCAIGGFLEALAADLAVGELRRLEEGESKTLLVLPQHVEHEALGVLDERIGA